jgi:Putative peptidoglycan binding domain.
MTVATKTRNARLCAVCSLVLACALAAVAGPRAEDAATTAKGKHPASASSAKSKTHTASAKHRKKKVRGQQKIDSERAQAIQEALIREHYLSGEATGTWNQASEDAMRHYQADHGWQSKTVPDSRALIKLGLGPSKDHLLNPESAMTTVPDAPRAESVPTTSHTAPAAANPVAPVAPSATPASSNSSSPQ